MHLFIFQLGVTLPFLETNLMTSSFLGHTSLHLLQPMHFSGISVGLGIKAFFRVLLCDTL